MAWILLGCLLVSGSFFLMVLRQISRCEERLRKLVIKREAWISKRFHAKLVVPPEGEEAR